MKGATPNTSIFLVGGLLLFFSCYYLISIVTLAQQDLYCSYALKMLIENFFLFTINFFTYLLKEYRLICQTLKPFM